MQESFLNTFPFLPILETFKKFLGQFLEISIVEKRFMYVLELPEIYRMAFRVGSNHETGLVSTFMSHPDVRWHCYYSR